MTADWQSRAACQNVSSELFFPSSPSPNENRRLETQAFAICHSCLVQVECGEFAQTSNRGYREQWGIWNGRNHGPKHARDETRAYTVPSGPVTLSCAVCAVEWRWVPRTGYRAPATCSYACSNELRARSNRKPKRAKWIAGNGAPEDRNHVAVPGTMEVPERRANDLRRAHHLARGGEMRDHT